MKVSSVPRGQETLDIDDAKEAHSPKRIVRNCARGDAILILKAGKELTPEGSVRQVAHIGLGWSPVW
jgi:hypothetical protein